MIYYLFFLGYLALGLFVSAALLWWAVRNGQFTGQVRAGWLPLEGEPDLPSPCPAAARWPAAVWGTLVIVLMSAVFIGTAVFLTVRGA